jgi:hypothetical protein
MSEIDEAVENLFNSTSKTMGVRGGSTKSIELFDNNFSSEHYNRLASIISMKNEVNKANVSLLDVDYKILDNNKVATFLEKDATRLMIKDYAKIYEELLLKSKYFQDGIFDYTNAFKVQKSLSE